MDDTEQSLGWDYWLHYAMSILWPASIVFFIGYCIAGFHVAVQADQLIGHLCQTLEQMESPQ